MKLIALAITLAGFLVSCGSPTTPFSQDSTPSFHEGCQIIDFPKNITMKRKLFNWGSTFNIYAAGGLKLGKIKERSFTWGRTLALYNADGDRIAQGKNLPFRFGRKIAIKDCNGNKLGTLSQSFLNRAGERVVKGRYAKYNVLNAQDEKLAESHNLTLLRTTIRFFDAQGQLDVILKKGGLLRDVWHVEQGAENDVDSRLWIFMAPFQKSVKWKK